MYFKSLDASQQLLISFAFIGLVLIEGYLNICHELNHKKMNWHIGQDIVAIVNHSKGCFKKNQIFSIRGLRSSICMCDDVEIDIGINGVPGSGCLCNTCGCVAPDLGSSWWFSETCFAPLDSLVDISELTEHLETTKPFEL